jgi:hypothetical protein
MTLLEIAVIVIGILLGYWTISLVLNRTPARDRGKREDR